MNNKHQIFLPLIISLAIILGIALGLGLAYKQTNIFSPDKEKQNKVNEIINYVNKNYVDSISIDALTEKAIKGMLQSLDPHSDYIPASEFNEVNDPMKGNFEGIGVQFRIERDTVTVIATISKGPSEKVGIKAGDRIVKINNQLFVGKKINNDLVIKNLKGKRGSVVNVNIKRNGISGLLPFSITRDVIPTYSIDASYIVKPDIGYIRINKFSATTANEFNAAMQSLHNQGMQKIIIDLRGNGGGYLEAAISVADELLENEKMIVYTAGKHSPRKDIRATSNGDYEKNKLTILIDDWSASASEILAGAVQDNDRGTIIGRRSFGKGLVQEQIKLKDGSAFRVTVSRYYTPTGRCIQKPYNKGVEDYYDKFYERFYDGEMESADSIHLNDSLKFKTPKGKIVYGGGGIMPDIYIPVKKTDNTIYYNTVLNKGVIYQFAFDYVDIHRTQLSKFKNFNDFNQNFNITNNMIEEFKVYALKLTKLNADNSFSKTEDKLKIQIKANIARNLLGDNAYYQIANTIDKTFTKAVEVLNKK